MSDRCPHRYDRNPAQCSVCLRAEVERLTTALQAYANPCNWYGEGPCDGGLLGDAEYLPAHHSIPDSVLTWDEQKSEGPDLARKALGLGDYRCKGCSLCANKGDDDGT